MNVDILPRRDYFAGIPSVFPAGARDELSSASFASRGFRSM
jgi:hypothetical protein